MGPGPAGILIDWWGRVYSPLLPLLPCRFHSHLMRLANDDLLTWRRKIVRWLRALSSKLRLTATIVTQGVALAGAGLLHA